MRPRCSAAAQSNEANENAGNICGTAFAGLIAIGAFRLSGVAGLEGWRWLFIVQGIPTFVLAIVSAFILPDEPAKTWCLTPEERELAVSRVAVDTVDSRTDTTIWTGLSECVKDKNL